MLIWQHCLSYPREIHGSKFAKFVSKGVVFFVLFCYPFRHFKSIEMYLDLTKKKKNFMKKVILNAFFTFTFETAK